ncbi:MAG: hypothetical protein ABI239_14270 [Aquihabitans sp.]
MPKLALVVSALLLVGSASACGTSGTSDADQSTTTVGETTTTTVDESDISTASTTPATGDADDYVAALAANLAGNSPSQGELKFTVGQAKCVATAWVDTIGVDTLTSNEVPPDSLGSAGFQFNALDLDEDQATAMVDAVDDCGVDWVAGTRDNLKVGLDPTQQKCLDSELSDETIRAVLVDALFRTQPAADLQAALDEVERVCEL